MTSPSKSETDIASNILKDFNLFFTERTTDYINPSCVDLIFFSKDLPSEDITEIQEGDGSSQKLSVNDDCLIVNQIQIAKKLCIDISNMITRFIPETKKKEQDLDPKGKNVEFIYKNLVEKINIVMFELFKKRFSMKDTKNGFFRQIKIVLFVILEPMLKRKRNIESQKKDVRYKKLKKLIRLINISIRALLKYEELKKRVYQYKARVLFDDESIREKYSLVKTDTYEEILIKILKNDVPDNLKDLIDDFEEVDERTLEIMLSYSLLHNFLIYKETLKKDTYFSTKLKTEEKRMTELAKKFNIIKESDNSNENRIFMHSFTLMEKIKYTT